MPSAKAALISLHVSALLLGATGLFSKAIQLPAWDITGYRTAIAALVLFAWIWWREPAVGLGSKRDYWRILLLGVLLAAHWITFFHSMQISNIAVGMISLYAFPVITTFLEPWLKRTPLDKRDILSGLLVLAGIYCLVPEFRIDNSTSQGVFWGLLSALAFAIRNVLLGHWFSARSAAQTMSYQVTVVALLVSPALFLSSHQPRVEDWWLLGLLGVVFTAIGHTLFGYSLRYLKATTVGLISCMQPFYAVIYGVLILGALPDAATIVGGAFIMTAAIYESVFRYP